MTSLVILFVYFLAALGLAFVVGFSKISLPLRVLFAGRPARFEHGGQQAGLASAPLVPVLGPWLVALMECPGCLGFWVGVLAFVFRDWLGLSTIFLASAHFWPAAIIFGLVTSAANMIGARYLGLVE